MSTRVAVVGSGSLGGPLTELLDNNRIRGCITAGTFGRGTVHTVDWSQIDILVEAAGAEAAREWLPPALESGTDVLLCSCGVLADEEFVYGLIGKPGRILVPAGAVGGLDLITAAARAGELSVRLTTTKRAGALGTGASGEIFRGTARQAACRFPKTSNVAVTLGLAVGDLDAVEVIVRADPSATRSSHLLEVDSAIGSYQIDLTNTVLPGSGGQTSALTLWSVVSTLEKIGPTALVIDPMHYS